MEFSDEQITAQAHEADASNEQFIHKQMPAWLQSADAHVLKALSQSLRLSQQYQAKVVELMRPLQKLQAFATPRFNAALHEAFGNQLSRRRDALARGKKELMFPESLPVGYPNWKIRYTEQSLLQAALHNFDADEAASASRLVILVRNGQPIKDVSVPRFASMCRKLDLGGQYQKHLDSMLSPAATLTISASKAKAQVQSLFKSSHRHDLQVEVHLAWLKQRIDEHWYSALQAVTALEAGVKYKELPVTFHQVQLFGVPLTGVIAFQARFLPLGHFTGISTPVFKLVVYLPGDPDDPLQEYTSWSAFEKALKGKLISRHYRHFFSRFVLRRNLPAFMAGLEQRLKTNASLSLDGPLLGGLPFDVLCAQRLAKIRDDARFLAVPTNDIDQAKRQAILNRALEIGLDILGLAAFVVPGLGEVVMGVAAAELMGQVFHGVEDWAQGQRHEAFECLTDMLENLVGLAAGAVVLSGAATLVKRSGFLGLLMPVKLVDGQTRLWKPDLQPYQWNIELPATSEPSSEGIHVINGQQFCGIDGKYYAIEREGAHGPWRMRHPLRTDAYAPTLEHDGRGAWRMSHEDPLGWSDAYAFRRFGHEFSDFSEAEISQILAVTGRDAADLQRLHLQNTPPDALLRDTCERLRLDRQIGQLIEGLEQNSDSLDASLFQSLQDALMADESFAWPVEVQSPVQIDTPLRQRMGLWLSENRPSFFQRCRVASQTTADPLESLVCRDFPGLPLPVAKAIVAQASDAERLRMLDETRVPLRLAEQAREQLQQVRLSRAYEGFYLASENQSDTDLLRAHFLPQHPGWPAGVEAELAKAQRKTAARLLGIRERPRVVLPQRHADGSIGYPLSGRSQAGRSLEPVASMIRELYPSYTDADIREYLANYRLSRLDVRTVLLRRREELAHLDGLLSRWQREGVSSRQRDSRQQASMLLRQAWRRQTSGVFSPFGMRLGTSLALDGMRIGELPMLGERIEFDYVAELSLHNMALEQVPSSFLGRFTQVRFLDLSNNALTAVPEAIKPMSTLKALRLRGNRIRLTENTGTALENLRHLEDLDLGGNPLGRLPDFSRMTRLRRLSLRATEITQAPPTLWGRPFLESVDLRDNRIEQLPETYFSEPPAFLRAVALDGNPLSTLMRERVRQYLRAPHMLEAAPRGRADQAEAFWLPPASRTEQQLQRWRLLKAEQGSSEFFRLLKRLSKTSDARLVRENLTERVQAVLEAAAENTRWRVELFEVAGTPRTCSDSVISNFSALEVKVKVLRAQDQAVDADAGASLLALARQLFRLEQVEAIAQADVAARAQSLVDPLEVSLGYRIKLASPLELPGQPQSMTFDHMANVTKDQINLAKEEVLRRESTEAWPRFLASRDFWVEHLKNRHKERFKRMQDDFDLRMNALEERQTELSDGQYNSEALALKAQHEQAEQDLLATLTEEERRRLCDPTAL